MKKIIILLTILFSVTALTYAQDNGTSSLIEEGIKLHDNGDYNGAIEKYKEALKIAPNSSRVNYEISFSYLVSKDYKKAVKFSKKVIALQSGNELAAYIVYGSALDMQGKTKKSIKLYETAMKDYDHYLVAP